MHPVADGVIDILSDAWSFLIIREAFVGGRRFEDLCQATGIPRSTLAERLRRLTREGVLGTIRYSQNSHRVKYVLTESGVDLYPVFTAFTNFGDKLTRSDKFSSVEFIHCSCEVACAPVVSCSSCCEPLDARDVHHGDRSQIFGASIDRSKKLRRSRHIFMKPLPSAVSHALEIIGDRWSLRIIREAFNSDIHFDSLQGRLGIASNMLSDRLKRLVGQGVLSRERYHSAYDRSTYRLTLTGHLLYGPLILAMAWNDRWLAASGPSLRLKHMRCGREFTPYLACDQCSGPINAGNMRIAEMAVGDIYA